METSKLLLTEVRILFSSSARAEMLRVYDLFTTAQLRREACKRKKALLQERAEANLRPVRNNRTIYF